MAAGSHSYTTAISLSVSDALKKLLTAQNQQFSYTVVSNPCYAKIKVEVGANLAQGLDEITKKVSARLSKYDIKEDPKAEATLFVNVSATETGNVQGLSENNTFIKTDVSFTMALKDDDGKELGSLTGKGTGMGGNLVKSAVKGVENVKIEKDLKALLEKICAGAAPAGPKLKLAVFDFKSRGGVYASWYDLAQSLSDMMITKLINTGKVDIVERSQITKIMEEKQLAQSGVIEEKEALQAAKLAGADIVLVGSAGIAGDKIEADARVVDMKTGIAKCAMNSASYSVSNIRAIADDLVGQIKGKCLK
jgi:TolB-like protein